MAKGDTATVYVRGISGPVNVVAAKAGRKLGIEYNKDANVQWMDVVERTWTDKIVKTTRFNASEVLAVETSFELDG